MTTPYKPKLIEVALPLDAISKGAVHEKNIRQSHPSSLHHWWARRPLVAARAVIWATLVDDPSAHSDRFPTEEEQEKERQRLFGILERLSRWDSSNDMPLIVDARAEIYSSCENTLPNILDPFCGGGAIPLEAQRLGVPSFGGDLNPVPVLISKALTEIPTRFFDTKPVNSSVAISELQTWKRCQGLSEDIHYYGNIILDRVREKIGHLYPDIQYSGSNLPVMSYIWARTVISPDPSWNSHIPLVNSWILREPKKSKPVLWVNPIINKTTKSITYKIREGGAPPSGTVSRGGGTCIATGASFDLEYVREQGRRKNLGVALIGVVAESDNGRMYFAPDFTTIPDIPDPSWKPTASLPEKALGFRVQRYGMIKWSDLFTKRQLVTLATFSDCLSEIYALVEQDAKRAGLVDDKIRLRDGGQGVSAYADAVVTYLSFAIDKLADLNNSLVRWGPDVQCPRHLFGRQAIPITWSYAEANPLGTSSGSWKIIIDGIIRTFRSKGWPPAIEVDCSNIEQGEVNERISQIDMPVICTDPPYYDNVPYADLSDFFYVWIRRNLSEIWPDECSTLLTPKQEELIADPWRSGSTILAREHFEIGMAKVSKQIAKAQNPDFPATIFYAFKQQENRDGDITSTGWETFLQGLVDAGIQVTATWPIRTETTGRLRAQGSAALASSIVLACRPRSEDAPMETRGGFVSALRDELPGAIRLLQQQNIAPVDMAQSAIGPGMRIFSRYSKVVEADGSAMPVRTALAHINEVLGEVLSEEESELDADSRFALTWFEQFGYEPGPYGDADVLARAKVTAVAGVVEAGIAESRGGKVRLLRREELEEDWSPAEDKRRTDWEATQHLIRLLDRSEAEAAGLLGQLGGVGDRARQLAYLLYAVCEEKNWSEEAVAYNGLITAWPELTRLVATTGAGQQSIL